MLALPSEGLKRSLREHNVNQDILCDWIEANLLFHQATLSGAEFVDLLVEQQYYDQQDFAWELFEILSFQVQQRAISLGEGYPLKHTGHLIESHAPWQEFLPYSFCLALSLARPFATWAESFGNDYSMQGALFEQLSACALSLLLPKWKVHRTGWSRTTSDGLKEVVRRLAHFVGEKVGNLDDWAPEGGKDGELDLACSFEFPDSRGGQVAYLAQCASGKNWRKKLHTPNVDLWCKLIDFTVRPGRCFAMPYVLPDKEFRQHALTVKGLFLDRLRLLAPGREGRAWLPPELGVQIQTWVTARVKSLPEL